jgi:hypothetical protein
MSDQPPASVAALIAQWRERAERHKKHGDYYRIGQGWGFSDCADELEALLGRLPVPRRTVADHYGAGWLAGRESCPICGANPGAMHTFHPHESEAGVSLPVDPQEPQP